MFKIIGFIFRTFLMIFLFLYGIKIVTLSNEITINASFWLMLFFRSFGTLLVFSSLYLLFNIFEKKVTEKSYEDWGRSVKGLIVLLILLILLEETSLKGIVETLMIAFSG